MSSTVLTPSTVLSVSIKVWQIASFEVLDHYSCAFKMHVVGQSAPFLTAWADAEKPASAIYSSSCLVCF